MTNKVFITGGTGFIGTQTIRRLVEAGVATTVFARNEEKTRSLFESEFKTGHLSFTKGDYDDVESFQKAIKGHTRMLLLVADLRNMPSIKQRFSRIAYEAGVQQIIDISSFTVPYFQKSGAISYAHSAGEEALYSAAKEFGTNVVVLRPGNFMTNHLMLDVHTIKQLGKIIGVGSPNHLSTLIDPRDIGDLAASVFQDPIEKHGSVVYDVHPELLSNQQRAEILSRGLGREITYQQVDISSFYDKLIERKIPHSLAYDFINFGLYDFAKPTPQISLLTKRPVRKFEDWVRENKQAFQ